TASFYGEPYVPYSEELPEYPAEGLPDYTPSYLPVTVENPFDPVEFTLTFAENEEVKYIRVTVIDDMVPELQEMGLFSLISNRGADIYEDDCTLTLMVTDNEVKAPSEIAFEVTDVYADQDEGKAVLTVKRTGGLNYMLTVSYSTADGTAEAGKQYVETSGQLVFMGDIDEQTIEVPLIAEAERADELDFTVTLSNVLGGGEEGLGMIVGGTVSVHLTSKGALLGAADADIPAIPEAAGDVIGDGEGEELYEVPEGLNIASVMALGSADSVQAPLYETEPLIGERQTVTGVQEEAPGEVVGEYSDEQAQPLPVNGSVMVKSFPYSPNGTGYSKFSGYKFSRGTNYKGWVDWEIIADMDEGHNSILQRSKKIGEASSSMNYHTLYKEIQNKNCDNGGSSSVTPSKTSLKVETSRMSESSFSIKSGCSLFDYATWNLHWTQYALYKKNVFYETRYIFPEVLLKFGTDLITWNGNITDGHGDKCDRLWFSGTNQTPAGYNTLDVFGEFIWPYTINSTKGDITYDLTLRPYTSGGSKWNPKEDYDFRVDNPTAIFELEMSLRRRYFTNDTIGLKIFTANDADNITSLNDPNLTALTENSPLYGSLRPAVSIDESAGGINYEGKIYVGSRLNIKPPAGAGGYSIKYVFLTDSQGRVKTYGTDSLTMLWSGMTSSDIKDSYTLNVVMDRTQTIELDVSMSLPRDSAGNQIKTDSAIASAWSLFGTRQATVYYTSTLYDELSAKQLEDLQTQGKLNGYTLDYYLTNYTKLKSASVALAKDGVKGSIKNYKNIQGICFNQDANDVLLYDGDSYSGTDVIWLKEKDISTKTLPIKFVDSSAQTYLSKMDVTIVQTQVYFDGNGNGMIDGWFDAERNLFNLDEASGDENLGFFDDTEIDEYAFAPVYKLINGEKKLCQYFIKVYYSMTPRSLTTPPGHSENETVRILPAFTTTLTSDEALGNLTREQNAFRYIQAGSTRYVKDGASFDTSAGHLMYTSAAQKLSTLDIPLGGDRSPAVQESAKKYSWHPDYIGNLMIDFAGPEPIISKNNMTLNAVSIAGEAPTVSQRIENGNTINTYTYSSAGAEKLNGYLGSFYGNSTFAVCVNEKNDIGSLSDINPETVTIGTLRTLPNADYLALINSTDSDDNSGKTDSEGKGEMPEFEVDMGIELPSLEIGQIGLGDYLKVIMDGKSVGLTIGLPLAGYESSKSGDSPGEKGGKGFKDSNETFTNLTDFISACAGKYAGGLMDGGDYIKNMFSDGWDKAKNDKGVKVKDIEVNFSVSLAIMFEYNPIDDGYYFQSAGISASVELQAKFTYRLTVCPIVYFYLKISASVELSTGLTVARVAVEGASIPVMSMANAIIDKNRPVKLDSTDSISFTINIGEKMRGFHVTLDGAVYMEVKDSTGEILNSGKLSSEGGQQEIILPSEYSSK
nr:hypothetical protein [Clostridiales bacterium]